MEFRVADTFTASLARLTNDEQKVIKTALEKESAWVAYRMEPLG